MQLVELPYAYTYLSRLKNFRSLLGYLLREWAPLIIVLQVAYSAHWWLSTVMVLGFLPLYECGYLMNDIAETADEAGGDRIKGLRINSSLFWLSHIFVFLFVTVLLCSMKGARFALKFAGIGILVLGVLLLHTNQSTRGGGFFRVFTFTFLALYKFAPIVLPQVAVSNGQFLLMAVFLCYGFPRVIVYILRKFRDTGHQLTIQGSIRWFEFAGLVVFAPIMITASPRTRDALAFTLIWVLYCVVSLLLTALNLLRHKFSSRVEQVF